MVCVMIVFYYIETHALANNIPPFRNVPIEEAEDIKGIISAPRGAGLWAPEVVTGTVYPVIEPDVCEFDNAK